MKPGDTFEIPHEGERWTIIRSAIHEGGSFVAEVAVAPGKGPPQHSHEHEDEVMEILEGSVTFVLVEGARVLRAGDTLHLPAGTKHAFKAGPQGFRCRSTYSGHRFEELVAQLAPGDKRGFVRMIQHSRRTNWSGSRLNSRALRAVLGLVAVVGGWLGIRPHAV
jgi:quercetin dioxygenase-like cupin family protein